MRTRELHRLFVASTTGPPNTGSALCGRGNCIDCSSASFSSSVFWPCCRRPASPMLAPTDSNWSSIPPSTPCPVGSIWFCAILCRPNRGNFNSSLFYVFPDPFPTDLKICCGFALRFLGQAGQYLGLRSAVEIDSRFFGLCQISRGHSGNARCYLRLPSSQHLCLS